MNADVRNRYLMGGALIALIFGFFLYSKLTELPNCETSPASKLVILIDQTDKVTDLQEQQLKIRVSKFINNLREKSSLTHDPVRLKELDTPVNSLVSVFYIRSNYKEVKPEFFGCRLPNGADTNVVTADPAANKKEFESKFFGPLMKTIKIESQGDKASPILETLSAISRTHYFSPMGQGKPKTRVLIFSDLIQHSEVSMYGCVEAKSIFENQLIKNVRESYKSAEVYLNIIERDKRDSENLPSQQCLNIFWQNQLNPFEVEAI
jgi:hypothetical protein